MSIQKDSLYETTAIFVHCLFTYQISGTKCRIQVFRENSRNRFGEHLACDNRESFAECQLLGTLSCFGRITVIKF